MKEDCDNMQLTKYEEDMYNGEYGEGKAECRGTVKGIEYGL